MMKNKNTLDQHFSSRLKAHEVTPPPGLWNRVQQRSQRRALPWAVAVAAVLLLSTAMYTGYQMGWLHSRQVAEEEVLQVPEKKWENIGHAAQRPLVIIPEMSGKPALSAKIEVRKNDKIPARKDAPAKIKEKLNIPPTAISAEISEPDPIKDDSPAKVTSPKEPEEIVLLRLPLHKTGAATRTDVPPKSALESEKDPAQKEIYAYANDQFKQLLKGQKLQLPHLNKEPVLTIHLQPLFKNN